jgi:hypothetical protein
VAVVGDLLNTVSTGTFENVTTARPFRTVNSPVVRISFSKSGVRVGMAAKPAATFGDDSAFVSFASARPTFCSRTRCGEGDSFVTPAACRSSTSLKSDSMSFFEAGLSTSLEVIGETSDVGAAAITAFFFSRERFSVAGVSVGSADSVARGLGVPGAIVGTGGGSPFHAALIKGF